MKAHLIDSQDPIKEGATLIANCGAEVPQAKFVFLWDNEEYPEFLSVSMTRICRHCARAPLSKRYVYGIVNAQELLDRNRQVEAVAA